MKYKIHLCTNLVIIFICWCFCLSIIIFVTIVLIYLHYVNEFALNYYKDMLYFTFWVFLSNIPILKSWTVVWIFPRWPALIVCCLRQVKKFLLGAFFLFNCKVNTERVNINPINQQHVKISFAFQFEFLRCFVVSYNRPLLLKSCWKILFVVLSWTQVFVAFFNTTKCN